MNTSNLSNSITVRAREESFDDSEEGKSIGHLERHELAQMARGLRRMKRQLFLKLVEEQNKPVDNLQGPPSPKTRLEE